MKQLILQTLLFLTISISINAQRSRVQIQDGTLVTDRGTLLHGAYISTDYLNYIPTEDEISAIKELGLNCVHLYAECAAVTESPGHNYVAVDSIINMTERDSLYLVLTIGNCGDEGSFDSSFVNDFWKYYAPRYKDKTHVIYEIMNEPFAWSAPYDSRTLTMERQAYDTIRSYAPETHILFMSYAGANNADSAISDIKQLGDVDWSKASIATHGYQISSEEFRPFLNTFIDSGYAITCTEFESIGNRYVNQAFTRIFEEEFISYMHFIFITEIISNPSVFKSPIESSEIRWIPDFGTWPESLPGINYKNPYQRFEAGFYDEGSGFKLHYLETILGYISNEDYVAYYNFDFEDGPDSLILECSAGNLAESSGNIELILDSLDGNSIGLYPISHTESWDDYETFRFPITTHFEGIHKFYFVFRGDHPWDLMNLKSITYKKSDVTSNPVLSLTDNHKIKIYPNPAIENITVLSDENASLKIFNIQGELLLTRQINPKKNIIPVGGLSSGNYIVKISNNGMVLSELLLIE